VAHVGGTISLYTVLVENRDRKRQLGKCRYKLEDNIKVDT
jgi:hypothetical protein